MKLCRSSTYLASDVKDIPSFQTSGSAWLAVGSVSGCPSALTRHGWHLARKPHFPEGLRTTLRLSSLSQPESIPRGSKYINDEYFAQTTLIILFVECRNPESLLYWLLDPSGYSPSEVHGALQRRTIHMTMDTTHIRPASSVIKQNNQSNPWSMPTWSFQCRFWVPRWTP